MREKGFSLIELLVTIAIILIIAVIAAASFFQARKPANESAAISNLRTFASAEFTYAARNSEQFGRIADLNSQGMVDNRFSSFPTVFSGFQYTENAPVQQLPPNTTTTIPGGFGINAIHQGSAGDYDFAVGPDGVIRYGPVAPSGRSAGDPIGR